ncbi:hypothetical protein HAX54_001993 [Datura stramonium]|uniref:Uncharacterized protein n=1 Tax=Datura stramonium TaxID=4076 RepID=A0ABS8WR06_DATST|nr:hypothetical protein [Datura stramonium]
MDTTGTLRHHREDLRCKIEGVREIYAIGLEITTRGNVKRCIFEEVEIRFSDLTELPNIKELFDHYCIGWMRDLLFMDLLEENIPRDMLALMGEGASIVAESSAIEANTPTTSSANRVLAVPPATKPPILILAIVFT